MNFKFQGQTVNKTAINRKRDTDRKSGKPANRYTEKKTNRPQKQTNIHYESIRRKKK